MSVKFQSDTIIITPNLAASRLREIWRKPYDRLVNRGPGNSHTAEKRIIDMNSIWSFYQDVWTLLHDTFRHCWNQSTGIWGYHYSDVIIGAMTSQITSLTIVYSTVYSGADQRNHQSTASLAFVRGIHWWPVNSRHKGPVTRKMFPCDDVIVMSLTSNSIVNAHILSNILLKPQTYINTHF